MVIDGDDDMQISARQTGTQTRDTMIGCGDGAVGSEADDLFAAPGNRNPLAAAWRAARGFGQTNMGEI